MYAATRSFAESYHRVHVETGTQAADPHKLIEMLLQGAIDDIYQARGPLDRKAINPKGEQSGQAVRNV